MVKAKVREVEAETAATSRLVLHDAAQLPPWQQCPSFPVVAAVQPHSNLNSLKVGIGGVRWARAWLVGCGLWLQFLPGNGLPLELAPPIGFGSNLAKFCHWLASGNFLPNQCHSVQNPQIPTWNCAVAYHWQKNASGKPLACHLWNFCHILEFVGTYGICCHLQKLLDVSTIQLVRPCCACFSRITFQKADDNSNDGELV